MSRNLILVTLSLTLILSGCRQPDPPQSPEFTGLLTAGLGVSLTPPTTRAIMLPPPTTAQQIQQPEGTFFCGPAVAVTLHRIEVQTDYPLERAKNEMCFAQTGGTYTRDLVAWLKSHGMTAETSSNPKSDIRIDIFNAIKSGLYVIAMVYPRGDKRCNHFVIIHGLDSKVVLVADSVKWQEKNLYAVDATIFRDYWLIDEPLILVGKRSQKP